MLQETRENLAGSRIFEFRKVDANDKPLPFTDASFDTVIANHMLSLVSDRQGLFSEIRRILKPNGQLYASTVGRKQHFKEMGTLLGEFDPALASWWKKPVDPFNLENGADQLASCFTDISLNRHEDALEVPEFEPIVDYIVKCLSGYTILSEDRLDALKKLVKQKVNLKAVFFIFQKTRVFLKQFECNKILYRPMD